MAIKIGNNNKIKRSTIIDNSNSKVEKATKETFANRHPILIGVIGSIIAGVIMAFWDKVSDFIKGLF